MIHQEIVFTSGLAVKLFKAKKSEAARWAKATIDIGGVPYFYKCPIADVGPIRKAFDLMETTGIVTNTIELEPGLISKPIQLNDRNLQEFGVVLSSHQPDGIDAVVPCPVSVVTTDSQLQDYIDLWATQSQVRKVCCPWLVRVYHIQ